MKLSITTAWNETAAFLKREWGAVFLIAFALNSLPGLIFQAALPGFMAGRLGIAPGSPPDPSRLVAALPLIFALAIPILLLSMWGNLTINVLALGRETVVGSAFARAARRLLPLVGAVLLLTVVVLILFLPAMLLLVSGIRSGHLGLGVLLFILLCLGAIFVSVRLLLTNAVAAGEEAGPLGILRRSWELTAGHFWKLLGFLVLMMILFVVIVLVVGALSGLLVLLIAGQPTPGSLAAFLVSLVSGLVQAGVVSAFLVLVARIYAQLAGDAESVGRVFE